MHKSVKVDDLLPGMMVSAVIEQSGPMKIRKVGMIRSPDMVKGLKEMGVSLLEVDLDQSLNVEFEGDEPVGAQSNAEESEQIDIGPITATQRLVATNKKIADVDRQLSQQFHRSLFLPAVDQMPSKWTLYGKPYGYLLAIIGAGFLIGWLGVSVPKMWLGSPSQTVVQNSNAVNNDAKLGESESANSAEAVNAKPAVLDTQQKDTLNNANPEGFKETQLVSQGASDTSSLNNRPTKTEQINPNVKAQVDRQASVTQALENKPAEDVDPVQYDSVNGVVLEAGQQVLGYQSGSEEPEPALIQNDEQANSGNNQLAQTPNEETVPEIITAPGFTSITSPQEGDVDSDLLRRIKRVADAVDSERVREPEPLPRIVAVGDLPRIDQLPPAILTQMPSMSFSAHMFASNPEDRWVRVNGKRLAESGFITDELQLKRIESEKVVLEFREHEFTMNALTDW